MATAGQCEGAGNLNNYTPVFTYFFSNWIRTNASERLTPLSVMLPRYSPIFHSANGGSRPRAAAAPQEAARGHRAAASGAGRGEPRRRPYGPKPPGSPQSLAPRRKTRSAGPAAPRSRALTGRGRTAPGPPGGRGTPRAPLPSLLPSPVLFGTFPAAGPGLSRSSRGWAPRPRPRHTATAEAPPPPGPVSAERPPLPAVPCPGLRSRRRRRHRGRAGRKGRTERSEPLISAHSPAPPYLCHSLPAAASGLISPRRRSFRSSSKMAAPHPARHLSAAHRPAGARLLPRAWLLPPRTALLPGGRAPNCRWSAPPRSPAPSRRRHLGAVAAEEVRCGPSEPRGHGGLRLWRLLKASAFSNVGPSAAPRPAPARKSYREQWAPRCGELAAAPGAVRAARGGVSPPERYRENTARAGGFPLSGRGGALGRGLSLACSWHWRHRVPTLNGNQFIVIKTRKDSHCNIKPFSYCFFYFFLRTCTFSVVRLIDIQTSISPKRASSKALSALFGASLQREACAA